jgi:glucose/arabinose dehydrogenase
MQRVFLSTVVLSGSLCLGLAACAATPPQDKVQSVAEDSAPAPAPAEPEQRQCDATSLGWAVGKVADDALIARAQAESGASSVRVLRPGMMVTQEFNGMRLNIRVDTERKVLATSCG